VSEVPSFSYGEGYGWTANVYLDYPKEVIRNQKFNAKAYIFIIYGAEAQVPLDGVKVDLWYYSPEWSSYFTIGSGVADNGVVEFTDAEISEVGKFELALKIYDPELNFPIISVGYITVRDPVLTVKITDEKGNPLMDVKVRASNYTTYRAYTNESGIARMRVYGGVEYDVLAYKDYYNNNLEKYLGTVFMDRDKEISGTLVYTGTPPPPPEDTIVYFTVINAYTKEPIESARIDINGITIYTDVNGNASAKLTVGKSYDVTVSKDGFKSWSGTIDVAKDLEVMVKLIPIIEVEFTLSVDKPEVTEGEEVTLYGTLKVNGKPFENEVNIYEMLAEGKMNLLTTVISTNGEFTVTIKPTVGLHSYAASTVIYQTEYWTQPLSVNVKEVPTYVFEITAEKVEENLYLIKGKLTDIYGNPVPNNYCALYVNGQYNQTAKTDENGEVQVYLELIEAGEYVIYMTATVDTYTVKSNEITLMVEAPPPPPPPPPAEYPKAKIISVKAPTQITAGQIFKVEINLKNEGADGTIIVRIADEQGNIITEGKIYLPQGVEGLKTFDIKAPKTPGKYRFTVQAGHLE